MLGSLAIPDGRIYVALWHALTPDVQIGEVVLGTRKSLVGRLAIPTRCRLAIARTASAVLEHRAQVVLRVSVALFPRLAKPVNGRGVIL